MRVDDIGDHICCVVPGGRSLVTVGMPGVTNTSQFKSRSSLIFVLRDAVCSLYLLFPRDPLSDIEWAVEEFSPFLLTPAQEADHVHVHQRHFVQIQHRSRSAALQLFFHCLKMLRLKLATQPKSRGLAVRLLFNS